MENRGWTLCGVITTFQMLLEHGLALQEGGDFAVLLSNQRIVMSWRLGLEDGARREKSDDWQEEFHAGRIPQVVANWRNSSLCRQASRCCRFPSRWGRSSFRRRERALHPCSGGSVQSKFLVPQGSGAASGLLCVLEP